MRPIEHVRLTADDTAGVAARADLHIAVGLHDFPYDPVHSRHDLQAQLAYPFPGGDDEYWLAYADGDVVGSSHVHLPRLDNTDNATVDLLVHPEHRRAGVGRQVAEHAFERARASGRRRVMGEICEHGPATTTEHNPGVAFAQSLGAERALGEARRRLDLAAVERAEVEQLLAGSEAASPDYHLVPWTNAVPAEVIEGVVTLESRMVLDSPMGDLAWEPERHDAERWHQMEAAARGRGRRLYGCAAVHTASGEVAGYTLCAIAPDVPEHAWQWATIVLPGHRGHRLGLRLKVHNQLRVTDAEPRLVTIDTWNASENRHMIAVNEALGFRLLDTWAEWQLDLR